ETAADRRIQLRVPLLLSNQVGKDARALLDGAQLEILVAGNHLGDRLTRPAEPTLGQRLVEESDRLDQEAHRLADDRRDQLVLPLEVAVHRAGAELRLAKDVLHRRPVKALLPKAAQSGGQDLAPARLDVLFGDLRHWASILTLTENGRYSIKNEYSF